MKRTLAAAAMVVVLVTSPPVWAGDGSISDLFLRQESGGGMRTMSTSSTAAGGYQIMYGSLQSVGFIAPGTSPAARSGAAAYDNASWTGPLAVKYGIHNLEDYRNNPVAQQAAFNAIAGSNYRDLISHGTDWNGKTVNGLLLNQSALVECAYVLGGAGCNSFLNGGTPDPGSGGTASMMARMQNAEQYDSASITGQATTQGGGTPTTGQATNMTPTGSALGIYCNPAVAQAIIDVAKVKIQSDTVLATNPMTGFTLLDGSSVLGAAGLGGSGNSGGSGGGSFFQVGGNGSFRSVSCLENLLSGEGLSVLFTPPNIDAILAIIENAVCQKATQMLSQVLQPLQQSLYKSADLGGFLPGMNLGSIGSLQINSGNGQGGINVGVGEQGNIIRTGSLGDMISSANGGDSSWYSKSSVFRGSGMQAPPMISMGGLMD